MKQQARNWTRWMIAGAAAGLRLPDRHAQRRRLGGRWGIILGYHRVIPTDEPTSPYRMGMGSDLFDEQIRWLASHHRIVSMEEFLRWHSSESTPPEDLVVLTFDDGYRDNLTHAASRLKSLGLPAIFYVTSGGLTDRMPYWPETLAQMIQMTEERLLAIDLDLGAIGSRSYALPLATPAHRARACATLIADLRILRSTQIERAVAAVASRLDVDPNRARENTPRLLDATDVRALSADGFAIGSHSATHPYLPSEDAAVQRREVEDSKRVLEETIRSPVLDFCYPGGGYDAQTRALVRDAGYRSAVTWEPGVAGGMDDPFALPRKGIGPGLATGPSGRFSPSMMEGEISGSIANLIGRRSGRRS